MDPTGKGGQYLRAARAEATWATARTATRPQAWFRRLARASARGNQKKAASYRAL